MKDGGAHVNVTHPTSAISSFKFTLEEVLYCFQPHGSPRQGEPCVNLSSQSRGSLVKHIREHRTNSDNQRVQGFTLKRQDILLTFSMHCKSHLLLQASQRERAPMGRWTSTCSTDWVSAFAEYWTMFPLFDSSCLLNSGLENRSQS